METYWDSLCLSHSAQLHQHSKGRQNLTNPEIPQEQENEMAMTQYSYNGHHPGQFS